MLPVVLDEVTARCHTGQLLNEQAALAPSSESKLTDQLLIPGFAAGCASNLRQQFSIVH
jgi:hypothetical protein